MSALLAGCGPQLRVEGMALGRDGAPVVGASVAVSEYRLRPHDDPEVFHQAVAVTDKAGRFAVDVGYQGRDLDIVLTGARPCDWARVSAAAGSFDPHRPYRVRLVPDPRCKD